MVVSARLKHRKARTSVLIGNLATYARINQYGFIETPYRKVYHRVDNNVEQLVGKILRETIADPTSGEIVARRRYADHTGTGREDRRPALPQHPNSARYVSANDIDYL